MGLWKSRFSGPKSLPVTVPITQSFNVNSLSSFSQHFVHSKSFQTGVSRFATNICLRRKTASFNCVPKITHFKPYEHVEYSSDYSVNISRFFLFSLQKAWAWAGLFGSMNRIFIHPLVSDADGSVELCLWKPRLIGYEGTYSTLLLSTKVDESPAHKSFEDILQKFLKRHTSHALDNLFFFGLKILSSLWSEISKAPNWTLSTQVGKFLSNFVGCRSFGVVFVMTVCLWSGFPPRRKSLLSSAVQAGMFRYYRRVTS